MCVNCIRNDVDICEGIPTQAIVHFCSNCERYLQPPGTWVACTLESRELIALLLKKLKGLSKVRLVDASFIWTEPHSKRVKLKITIQKEVYANTVLQQTLVIEFVVAHQQCDACTKVMAQNTWNSVVQVRQKVNHKRTFFYLEQLILKHSAHKDTINIKPVRDGIDFYYSCRGHAVKMIDFLNNVVPVRSENSRQLISTDIHCNISNYKFTYSVEIIPVCKDDLVCLPKTIAKSLGNIYPLGICYRVGNSIHFMDVSTMSVCEIASPIYWRYAFASLRTSRELTEFYVLNVEPVGATQGKITLADIEVVRMSEMSTMTQTFITRSHLGNLLNPGDTVLGYDLINCNINSTDFDRMDQSSLPDIILVKKHYATGTRRSRKRKWQLKKLMDIDEDKSTNADQDYELFLRELEEDPEMRQGVNLYKRNDRRMSMSTVMSDGEIPQVPIEELLEELTLADADGMNMEE